MLAPASVPMDSLDVTKIQQGWGEPHAGKSVEGNALTIAGQKYDGGIGTHAVSLIAVELDASCEAFDAMVGVDDETKQPGSVEFIVWVDRKRVVTSGLIRSGEPAKKIHVDLRGAKRMWLRVEDGGDGINYDHADWADAMFTLRDGATARPRIVELLPSDSPVSTERPTIAMPKSSPQPAIHGPRVAGTTPGRPFLFRIPATGEGELAFSAENLPSGLAIDTNTGIITGSVRSAGETDVALTVKDSHGTTSRKLRIVAGDHKLALTPPMGWNSWNVWGTAVDAAKVRAAADAMVSSGLAAHGYQFINIDDAWEGARDANGQIQTNEKFGDMKALADYVHSKGLKIGIYSSPGPKTCAGYEGSFGHEEQDARTYARWGIDYLKFDWCSCQSKDLREPYLLMRRALDMIERDIVYSLCQYGMGDVWTWGEKAGGNLWRTTGDISDSWGSMIGIAMRNIEYSDHARPGHWNDPDMLVVGKVGWGPSLHDSHLLPIEQQTHISLWTMMAAPLLVGCDMTQLDEFTRALLMNDEVIELDQDPLSKVAKRVWRDGDVEVWSRPLWDGTIAVCLLNRGYEDVQIAAKWSDLGLGGAQPVRDVWQQKDLGEATGHFATTVRGHGTVLLKIGRARVDKQP
jgi:alpha-galactosidase